MAPEYANAIFCTNNIALCLYCIVPLIQDTYNNCPNILPSATATAEGFDPTATASATA